MAPGKFYSRKKIHKVFSLIFVFSVFSIRGVVPRYRISKHTKFHLEMICSEVIMELQYHLSKSKFFNIVYHMLLPHTLMMF